MFGPLHDIELLKAFKIEQELDDPVGRRDILALFYFHNRLLFHPVNPDWTFQGCSFSSRGLRVLLVVKATKQDIPYVAYVTEQTTTGCVRVFARQWLEGRVKWHRDKFRST